MNIIATSNTSKIAAEPAVNTLGIAKPPAETRVLVALSGGVDSAVTAALLADQGYQVVAVTLQLYPSRVADRAMQKGKAARTCCAGRDIYDARRVAEQIGIPHYVLDYQTSFKRAVIGDFVNAYQAGETPIPCVRCNERVKFGPLLELAQELSADCMATGHYVARRIQANGQAALYQAADSIRDQSYFLFSITQAQLNYVRFPLGDMASKQQTRALAKRFGLALSDKPDSQDICFVAGGKYAETVRAFAPASVQKGDIVDIEGRVRGQHTGIHNFTIGQRRGLNIGGLPEPLYVVRIIPESQRVVVGPLAALACSDFTLKQISWLGDAAFDSVPHWRFMVKVRATRPPLAATIYPQNEHSAKVVMDTPESGVAPGQACVFYSTHSDTQKQVFGGGWIVRNPE